MSDHTNDINELLALFERLSRSTSGSLFARRHNALAALVAERNAAIKQRDEARRLYCHAQARIPDGRPEQLAQTLGWDCFKEGTEQC
jgi:hypothetical protein